MSRASKSNTAVLDTPNGEAVHDQADDTQSPTSDHITRQADVFDNLEALRTSQEFATTAGVRKALTEIAVRRPAADWFCRVHPDPSYRLTTSVLDLPSDKTVYLVVPALRSAPKIGSLLVDRLLVTAINRDGELFLWPVKLNRADGKENRWNSTAMEAVNMAVSEWTRMSSNPQGFYDKFPAEGLIPDPIWSELSFSEILRLAFKDNLIDRLDHPVLKRLRGEV
jgi:hypothetical protein